MLVALFPIVYNFTNLMFFFLFYCQRILRKSATIFNGCVIFDQMLDVLGKFGIKLSDRNKEFILSNYSLSKSEASRIRPVSFKNFCL